MQFGTAALRQLQVEGVRQRRTHRVILQRVVAYAGQLNGRVR